MSMAMVKNNYTQTDLSKGKVRVYDFGSAKLHAYQTCDLIDDEVFVVEKQGKGFVIEYPCFFDNIKELENYIKEQSIQIEGIVASYHMAGASFMKGTPVYAAAEADTYGHEGGGKALIDGFVQAFGDAFDGSIATVTNTIEGDTLELAGVAMNIVRNDEAFDIQIPELNVVYTHMMGHDCHSIVPGESGADVMICQLKGFVSDGYSLILTSHYVPEDLKDAQIKIDYLENLKDLAAESSNAADFKAKVQKKYPLYAGENYLDMTCGMFFAN